MIGASAGLASHLEASSTTLATLWLVTRSDASVFAFTDHDADIEFDSVTYIARYGFQPSALQQGAGLAVSNAEVKTVFYASGMTEDDLRSGVWDHADVRVRLINWTDTAQGVLKIMRGRLGEVRFDGLRFTAELRGMADPLNRAVGEIVGPGCNAALGDARCGKSLTDYTTTGEVTAVTDNREFDTDLSGATVRLTPTTTGAPPDDYFNAGKITWSTGSNSGRSMEVKSSLATGEVVLQLQMVADIQPGDTFTIVAGCIKSRAFCAERFGNVVNFRGFPDLPGLDKMLRYGGQ